MTRERRRAAFMNSRLVSGHAAGRIGISGGRSEAVPGGDDAFLEVHTECTRHAGISADGRIEPDRDLPAFLFHFFLTDRLAQREIHLVLVHAAQDVPVIDSPAHAFRVRRIVVAHQPVAFRVAPG